MDPSFESVFMPHYPRVFRVILRMVGNRETAQELTQETYLKAYRQHPAPNSNPAAWLCRIAMHLALDSLRRQKRWWHRLPRLTTVSQSSSFEQSVVDGDLGRSLALALPEKNAPFSSCAPSAN
jgi:RNA polymerase sigma factor (sigma-70 family)